MFLTGLYYSDRSVSVITHDITNEDERLNNYCASVVVFVVDLLISIHVLL